MRSRPLRSISIVSVTALALALFAQPLSADDALCLTVMPFDEEPISFGKLASLFFVVQNNSKHVVVIQQVTPLNDVNEPLTLSSSVYGSLRKDDAADAYEFNPLSQQATQLPFYGGLLLPGEKVVALSRHRPVAKREELRITYYTSSQVYDGSIESMHPFQVYVRAQEKEAISPRRYVPFTMARWNEINGTSTVTRSLGPDNMSRAVIIPTLEDKAISLDVSVVFRYEGAPFCLEDATRYASRISGKSVDLLRFGFSSFLNQYVVFEEGVSWLLASKEQKDKGSLLTAFPPVLLNDLDSSPYIRVRIGDKQEGFGMGGMKSSRKLWDCYPVYYGDGMYTRGEFLHLAKEEVVEFLRLARTKGKILKPHNYFFSALYYTLSEKESSRPAPAADSQKSGRR